MVAIFHSLVGLAAVTTSIGSHIAQAPHFASDPLAMVHQGAIWFGTLVGAVALALPGESAINVGLLAGSILCGTGYMGF